MGDDVPAGLAHGCLAVIAAYGISNRWTLKYNCPGMHGNFLVHGILGICQYNKSAFGSLDVSKLVPVSMNATRYLAIPFVMADFNRYRSEEISLLHLASGIVPFVLMTLEAGKTYKPLAELCLIINVAALGYYSFERESHYGYGVTALAILSYFVIPEMGANAKVFYPISLAFMEWCVYRSTGFHTSFG